MAADCGLRWAANKEFLLGFHVRLLPQSIQRSFDDSMKSRTMALCEMMDERLDAGMGLGHKLRMIL